MTDHADTIRRAIIGHAVQACYDNGESWNLVCDCQWECWEQPDERTAKALHARHRADEEREAEAALDALLAELDGALRGEADCQSNSLEAPAQIIRGGKGA